MRARNSPSAERCFSGCAPRDQAAPLAVAAPKFNKRMRPGSPVEENPTELAGVRISEDGEQDRRSGRWARGPSAMPQGFAGLVGAGRPRRHGDGCAGQAVSLSREFSAAREASWSWSWRDSDPQRIHLDSCGDLSLEGSDLCGLRRRAAPSSAEMSALRSFRRLLSSWADSSCKMRIAPERGAQLILAVGELFREVGTSRRRGPASVFAAGGVAVGVSRFCRPARREATRIGRRSTEEAWAHGETSYQDFTGNARLRIPAFRPPRRTRPPPV